MASAVEWQQLADCSRTGSCQKAALRQEENNQTPINTKESVMETTQHRESWNKGKLVGQKPPLKPKDIWAIRTTFKTQGRFEDWPCSILQ